MEEPMTSLRLILLRWATLAFSVPLVALAAAPVALVSVGCASLLAPAPRPAPAGVIDPPRRPNKPLVYIAMPGSESFQVVRRSLVKEIEKDLDVATSIVDAETSAAEFKRRLEASGAALVVVMDNPTVKLYREYQRSCRGAARPIPAVVAMSSFLEEVAADLEDASGVAYEVPGVTALVKLRAIIDRPVRRVAVLHRPPFQRFLERQKALAAKEQITLVPVRLPAEPSAAEVRAALMSLRDGDKIDALWLLNDNRLLRDPTFLETGWREPLAALGVPVVVGIPALVNAEAHFGTLAVLPDLDALGVQTANVVLDLAESGWQAKAHPVELPVSTLTVVNVGLARAQFGLRADALRLVDKAIE
jgi:hypothetical protein